ncbi:hypothetical protein RHGRI_017138 [Rhododendron griersonianum]|uniref:Lipoprotein n=1 Tax=Rhododendron griersonianum TaxID=479676 RepID=A0AAV6JWS8_9ERIC|nr:hypothetical protein RHGRI_017138 [Rhododendron griersonianum]
MHTMFKTILLCSLAMLDTCNSIFSYSTLNDESSSMNGLLLYQFINSMLPLDEMLK